MGHTTTPYATARLDYQVYLINIISYFYEKDGEFFVFNFEIDQKVLCDRRWSEWLNYRRTARLLHSPLKINRFGLNTHTVKFTDLFAPNITELFIRHSKRCATPKPVYLPNSIEHSVCITRTFYQIFFSKFDLQKLISFFSSNTFIDFFCLLLVKFSFSIFHTNSSLVIEIQHFKAHRIFECLSLFFT